MNLFLLIPFLMCIYSFPYFALKIHYHKPKFTPRSRSLQERHLDAILILNVHAGAAVCGSPDPAGKLFIVKVLPVPSDVSVASCDDLAPHTLSCPLPLLPASHLLRSGKHPFAGGRWIDAWTCSKSLLKSLITTNSRIRYTPVQLKMLHHHECFLKYFP